MTEQQQIEASIANLEAQRAQLGDTVVDTAVAALRARLEALNAPPRGQTLRQVSVLFLDMVGSTALAARLDPETVYTIMDSTLKACSAVVRAHGGAVLQYAGDSLLAAFGTPHAREDDAERAVRCGLALLPVGEALGRRVLEEHGHAGCQLRVGIHTGPVLLGGGVEDAGTIRGATVNLAARMEQTAPPGALRISQTTWRLVRGCFDMAEQPPLLVKGQAEPLRTWLVQAERPRAFRVPARGIDGLETAMIGREAELAGLMAAFDAVVRQRGPQSRTVLADAGLGKSRLLHELQHALDGHPQPFWLLLGRAGPSDLLQPYGLLRDLLAWRLQIADSDSGPTARHKLVEGLLPWLLPGSDEPSSEQRAAARLQAELVGQLIGMDFSANPEVAALLEKPRQLRDGALAACAAWLRAMAQRSGHPLVMLLDDLQWADDASLDALAPLLSGGADGGLPVLAVLAARPALLDRRPTWGDALPDHETLRLGELAGAEFSRLTRHLLERLPEPPPALLALIERHAAGNPFYAEELVKMFIDDGVIETGPEAWTFHAERLKPQQIPATLTGVLQARLDALHEHDRRALQWASVVGAVFWDEALGTLDPTAPDALPTLQQRALVHARPESLFTGTHERAFQHHLLHQVTYETVLKAERQVGHARAAEWLASRVGERSAEYMAVVAEHHERAGDAARAFDWYEKAVLEASRRFAQSAVLAHARKACALPPPADTRRLIKVLVKHAYACDMLGLREEQGRVQQHRMDLANQLDDDRERAEALSGQALLADRIGDMDRAGALARECIVVAERVGAAASAAIGWGELAWISHVRGDPSAALREAEAGLVWARRAREESASQAMYEMQLLVLMSYVQGDLRQLTRRRQTLLAAQAMAQARGERRTELNCVSHLADMALADADEAEAERLLEVLHEQALALQYTAGVGDVHAMRHRLAMLRGDPVHALEESERAAAIYVQTANRLNEALMGLQQGEALLALGRPAEALQRQAQAAEIFDALGSRREASACRLWMARSHLADGRLAEALGIVRAHADGLGAVDSPGPTKWIASARVIAWQVLQAAGDPRAAEALQRAHEELLLDTRAIEDPVVRARVMARIERHAVVVQACREAGLPLD